MFIGSVPVSCLNTILSSILPSGDPLYLHSDFCLFEKSVAQVLPVFQDVSHHRRKPQSHPRIRLRHPRVHSPPQGLHHILTMSYAHSEATLLTFEHLPHELREFCDLRPSSKMKTILTRDINVDGLAAIRNMIDLVLLKYTSDISILVNRHTHRLLGAPPHAYWGST